jgi:hypothetical protein
MTQDLCTGPLWDKGARGDSQFRGGKKREGESPFTRYFSAGEKDKIGI